MDKGKRPRSYRLKEAMDLILNSNDSDFGDSDFDDEDNVENSGDANADDSDSESESDSEDNQPLSKLLATQLPATQLPAKTGMKASKKVYVWTKQAFTAPDITFSGEKPQAPQEIASPLNYFKRFISDEMLTAAVENTNLYSVQKDGKSVEMDVKELEKVIGIYLQMGIVKMPGVRYYWENETRYPPVADTISRNRFQKLLTVLHFVDNFSVPGDVKSSDRLWKLRPWLESFRQNCLHVTPDEMNSIDEMMVPYKGRTSGIKQYMRGKPHAWGFKIWARTSVSGMLYDFDVYQGNAAKTKSEYGLSTDVVLKLTSTLPTGCNYKIFADNFFTSTILMALLLKRSIHYTGTVRNGRLPNCQLKDEKTLSKQGRGSIDSLVQKDPKIVAVRWFDNRPVTLASTFVGPLPIQKVRRWDKSSKSYGEIDRPFIVDRYNRSMGGVDQLDAFVALYRFQLRSKRWYMYLFWHSVTVGLINAWLLYRRDCQLLGIPAKEILLRRQFQALVGSSLVLINAERGCKRGRPSVEKNVSANSVIARKKARKGPSAEVKMDAVGHWPVKSDKRGRCALCTTGYSDTACEKCTVRLCFNNQRNCFKQYHDKR
jgi:Transposase IS4